MARGKEMPSLHSIFVGYYRANPKWLRKGRNDKVLEQFAKDYPNHPIDKSVKQAMANVKSRIKKGPKGRRGRKQRQEMFHQAVIASKASAKAPKPLAMLEEQIDDCMILVKQIGRESLPEIYHSLRRARNAVVMMLEG